MLLAFVLATFMPAHAQTSAPMTEALLALPDSPGTIAASTSTTSLGDDRPVTQFPLHGLHAMYQNVPPHNGVVAGHLDKYIKPYQDAPTLRPGDKVLLGFKDSISPLSAAGWLLSASWEQLVNGSPNYGTNGRAFAQRLGAAAARDVSEGVFSDSIMSTVLHQDPRYYKMGPGHHILKRAVYAATRTLITRTDGGHTTVNLAYLSGNLAGSALTQVYYPPQNRGFKEVMETYGGSIGGGALGFLASEFLDDVLHAVHHK